MAFPRALRLRRLRHGRTSRRAGFRFVPNELGIPTDIPQHASYIADWIKPLKQDKREIFRAAADAQKIADMELGFHPAYAAQIQIPRR